MLELTEIQMAELREKELNILKAFTGACEKLNVDYFVVQGTLLGAVRHKGFIPWDDDIDIGMMRDDYEKFIENADRYLPTDYFVQNFKSDHNFPHCFTKIRDCNTTFIETTTQNIAMNHGIFIDLFPFDYYPDSSLSAASFNIKKFIYRYRVRSVFYVPKENKITAFDLIKKFIMLAVMPVARSARDALAKSDKLYKSVKPGAYLISNGGPWGKREIIPCEWVDRLCELDFEGIKVKAFKDYDKYLTKLYGDYMTLPPVEERRPHHYAEVIDANNPYSMYFENGKFKKDN